MRARIRPWPTTDVAAAGHRAIRIERPRKRALRLSLLGGCHCLASWPRVGGSGKRRMPVFSYAIMGGAWRSEPRGSGSRSLCTRSDHEDVAAKKQLTMWVSGFRTGVHPLEVPHPSPCSPSGPRLRWPAERRASNARAGVQNRLRMFWSDPQKANDTLVAERGDLALANGLTAVWAKRSSFLPSRIAVTPKPFEFRSTAAERT